MLCSSYQFTASEAKTPKPQNPKTPPEVFSLDLNVNYNRIYNLNSNSAVTDRNKMVDSAFNKYRGKTGHGTLIGNWQEERDLRDFTGEGR